ncbi:MULTISPECIES: TIGR02594 family protein [Bradyrhizobium]|uniref:TIGR02594 family protein n=1 Tax=Bradyrhizobium arachidis TaxID=858423 RepID=A0AAE7TLJ8_9BRAD|nr:MULTISPECIES: TIGR02594 family protein [Bradyrhizobium]QOZ72474.1 TIGR02594 family protein [Bradyrhizobium arachidis]UFW48935.1 TIGR02594 family protein [Bradyrhizobium arachidis]SFU91552.1 TIGR02594 family protein [Bradyrhizobium arachidis]
MVELFAYRLSRCIVALAFFFAAVAAFVSPASARPHHRHSAERHAYVHHARHHHYRHHARSSRFERRAAQLQASGFADSQASYDPSANGGGMTSNAVSGGSFGGGSGVVSEARRYLGGNPTGRGSLWCARFMNMVLEHTGHRGTGSDMASSFARYGTRVSGPQVGAIAVMSRGRRGGHVGIITGIDAQGNPIMISGNNGNRVREAPVSRGRIYAYVMPN